MEKNSDDNKIVHLSDIRSYESIIKDLLRELPKMAIALTEYALNLMINGEFSDWNRKIKLGSKVQISNDELYKSDDKTVLKLAELSTEISVLVSRISKVH